MRKFLSFIWEIMKIAAIAFIIVAPIRYFLFQPFLVKGESMEPNFKNGNYLIVDEISYRLREPKRGEVIVFKYPFMPSQKFIKRVIGLPGETIKIEDGQLKILKDGKVYILNEKDYIPFVFNPNEKIEITLGHDEYFVLGDNRDFSYDSRRFGPVKKDLIIGRVLIRAWPFEDFSKFEAPLYSF